MAWNQEWLNQNAGRAYPFKEDSLVTDVTGSVRIPNTMIVDMCLVLPAPYVDGMYLRELTYAGNSMVFTLASGDLDIALVPVSLETHVTNQAYSIIGIGDFADCRGRMVLGDLSELYRQMPQGTFTFLPEATPLEIRAVRPDIRTVRSMRVLKADGNETQELYDIIQLVEGTNVRLTFIPATEDAPNSIRIDCLETDLEQACICDTAQVKPNPILSINGVYGDINGNIVLASEEDCLGIEDGSSKITLNDKCSSPCCGCPEIDFITTELNKLLTSVINLENAASKIEANQTNFHNNVLGTLV